MYFKLYRRLLLLTVPQVGRKGRCYSGLYTSLSRPWMHNLMLNVPRTWDEPSRYFISNSSQGDIWGNISKTAQVPPAVCDTFHLFGHSLPGMKTSHECDHVPKTLSNSVWTFPLQPRQPQPCGFQDSSLNYWTLLFFFSLGGELSGLSHTELQSGVFEERSWQW